LEQDTIANGPKVARVIFFVTTSDFDNSRLQIDALNQKAGTTSFAVHATNFPRIGSNLYQHSHTRYGYSNSCFSSTSAESIAEYFTVLLSAQQFRA
jgi:hypothetical protein